ncbi:hypothetical protein BASA61_006730 [Batrachochytrium salamandrivorans]|nr:hypothetical protein BASA61_006730 [Batrachochytrium salamandrivorans]
MEKQSVCVDSSSYTAPESIYSCGGLDTSAYTFGSAAQAVPNVLDKASRRPKQHSSAIPKGVGKAKDSPTRTTIPDILQRSILEGISSADPDKQLESIIYLFDCLTSSNSLSGASDAANVLYNHNNPQLNMRDTNDILASMPQCLQSDTWELRDAAMDLTLYTLSDTMKHSKQSIYPTVFLGADDEWLPTFKLIRDLVPILCGLTPKMDSQKQQQIIDLFFRLSSEYTDLGPLYEDIIHHGIDNGNWRARATNTRLIPRKFQRDVGCIKMSILLTALVGRFRDVSQVVVSEAAKAFAHINTAIGNEQLLSCLGVLSQDCQQIVLDEQALLIQNGYRLTPTDRKISDGSPLRQLTLGKSLTEKIPEIPNLFPSAANTRSSDIGSRHILGNTALSQSSLFSGSPNPCDILDSYTPSTVHGSRPISSQKTDLPLSPDNSDAGALQISFGFAPAISVRILQLNDTDWKKRSVAIESIFIASDNIRMDTFLPHINEFVEFSTLVLQDDNFKVVLTMLHIIEKILPVVGEAFQSRVPKLSTALVNKLADNSAVIRHTSGKVLILLMQATLPELVYNTVLVYISNANPRIREEMINVLTISLLAIPDQVVDVHFLARFLAPAVKDTKAKVRYVAVEACAVLAHRMGSSEVLSALKSHGLDVDIIQMLQVRFLNTNLPSLTGNGTLEHLISPPQFGVSKSVSLPQPIPLKAVAFRITATHSQQGIHKASPKRIPMLIYRVKSL